MSEDQLKCLVFVCGLKEETNKGFRLKLHFRNEVRADVTLGQLSAEFNSIANLKLDNAMIVGEREEQMLGLGCAAYKQTVNSSVYPSMERS